MFSLPCHALLWPRAPGGREHQVADRQDHKRACNAVKKAQRLVDNEEQSLRARPADMFLPANVFETGVGHFWGYHDTRPYMRARYGHVEALVQVDTYDAVQTALDNLMDMLRLCRSDNMGVRDLVPPIFLRLGKDQACYDFVKWWHTTGQEPDYDWGDMDEPYLDVKNADVFEPVDIYCHAFRGLSHVVSVTLLKIRLLLDIQALQNSACIGEKLPQELLDNVRGQLVSSIVAKNKAIMNSKDESDLIKELRTQLGSLYKGVKKMNKYFWSCLLQPEPHLGARPEAFSAGDIAQAQLALRYCYASWVETPGAIDVIQNLVKHDHAH